MKKILSLICAAAIALTFCGCSNIGGGGESTTTGAGSSTAGETAAETTAKSEYTVSYFVDGEAYGVYTYSVGDTVESVTVPEKSGYEFSGWDVTIPSVMTRGDITANAVFVKVSTDSSAINVSTVSDGSAYTISLGGTYTLTGVNKNAQVVINTTGEVVIVLDGLDLTYTGDGAAIKCEEAGSLTIRLAYGTENYVSDTSKNVSDGGAITVKKCDLLICGGGTLNVTSGCGNGIHNTKEMTVSGSPVINITSADHGINGKSKLTIESGTVNVTSSGDGIKSSAGSVFISGGVITVISGQDGVDAETDLTISGGTFDITSGGGYKGTVKYDDAGEEISAKGIKGATVTVSGGTFTADSLDDAVHSNGDFTVTGGSFTLVSGRDGVSADGSLTLSNAVMDITTDTGYKSSNRADISTKGIKSESLITIVSGTYKINSLDDAIHCGGDLYIKGGTFDIYTGDDGVHSDETLYISDGNVVINYSYEGLEGNNMEISGGDINLLATDDGINAAGGVDSSGTGGIFGGFGGGGFGGSTGNHYVEISGGKITVNAAGDGLDANGSVSMSGGTVIIYGPVDNGNGALDYDSAFDITGGIFIAFGSSGMAQAPTASGSTQYSLSVTFNSVQPAGGTFTVKDSSGNVILTYIPPKKYQNIVISSPDIKSGETYTVSSGTSIASLTVSNIVSTYGTYNTGGSQGGGGGGQPGMPGGFGGGGGR